MKDFKLLLIVAAITGILYWGVEPLAHSVMHPAVAPADYGFSDLEKIDSSKGNAAKGAELVMANCVACHGIKSQGFDAPMDHESASASYGVVPPDLSSAGRIYESNYLANFIKNPTKAAHLTHKFNESKPYPMPAYDWMSNEEIADIVAYFASIAPEKVSNQEVFVDACQRCHSMKYDKLLAETPEETLKDYMGSKAPDLSMMIRSKGEHYLHTFINEPQKLLHGTAMPRVGLNEEAEKQVVSYIESIGDSKKDERESLGIKAILFMMVLSVLAYLWKHKIWKEVE
ncbi:c-type cytochrome [Wolinella succinogenes]|uniref:UBIQUINOL CYTOCHROME C OXIDOREDUCTASE, CYTOCHROME C1 SUBUNIT n=1 Tax=Wolinella succinogenes (strain ATCC 29543 / DSM 1740 / CCUG 13145 / JCM 31913 / LMG 7466 / NCTC 11488 / FDC 602W) TaxID=273121 RepID=Q7M7Q0_WOLSU|nr:c-type cytochrome [Wolinella succinogenes]CAE11148.1 UBIQUINOL CYTOCHROME C OXIDOREDUCTASE, CYTOCHROME C1 SUBUNIT [Wolinella succinogenes]VEG81314.1 Cytochrome c, mono- and diheme variants [Wolinella succinogenes]HCZ19208.1 cytochrome C [Helicobacter sp.]